MANVLTELLQPADSFVCSASSLNRFQAKYCNASFTGNCHYLKPSFTFTFYTIFLIWFFLHEHSRFTGQQGKGEAISLTPLYHFPSLYKHLDICRAITVENSSLHIAGSRTQTGNVWCPSASR